MDIAWIAILFTARGIEGTWQVRTPYWSLLDKASKAWLKRDRLNKHIIHRTRSIPWDGCHSLGSQAIKDIKFLWDMQQSPDCA